MGIPRLPAGSRLARSSVVDFPPQKPLSECEAALRSHAAHYAHLLEQEGAQLLGTCEGKADQIAALQHLRVDQRNTLRSLDYALELHDPELLLKLSQYLRLPLEMQSEWRLMTEQYAALLTEALLLKDEGLELQARLGLARVGMGQSDSELALREAEAAEGLADALDDEAGLMQAWMLQAEVHWMRCDKQWARDKFEAALQVARKLNSAAEVCQLLTELGGAAQDAEDYLQAHALLNEAQRIAEERGLLSHLAAASHSEGNILLEQGQLEAARKAHSKSRELFQQLGDQVRYAMALRGLAGVAFFSHHAAEAQRLLELSLAILGERGDRYGYAMTLTNLASVYAAQDQLQHAAQLTEQSARIAAEVGDRHGQAISLVNVSSTYLKLGRIPEALTACRRALAGALELGNATLQLIGAARAAAILASLGRYPEAALLSSSVRESMGELPSSHLSSCADSLDRSAVLLRAAIDQGAIEQSALDTQAELGTALATPELAAYALRLLK